MNEGYAPGLYPIRIGTLSILDAALAGRTPAPVAKSVNGVGEEASEPSGLTPKQRKVWDWIRTMFGDKLIPRFGETFYPCGCKRVYDRLENKAVRETKRGQP